MQRLIRTAAVFNPPSPATNSQFFRLCGALHNGGNWLHVGGDGGLKTASVLLSVCASAMRHRRNPWEYLRDVLDHLAVRSAGADLPDLLPDAPVQAGSRLAA